MPSDLALTDLPPWAFEKDDPDDDAAFYAEARLVTHIDDGAITALTEFYRRTLPAGGIVLDLMSSCVSHLPDDAAYGEVIGHGMNAEELAANPQLTRWFVHDLNRDPALPLEAASVDAAMICVGVQYLQRPVPVFQDIARVLKPGAPLVVTFSSRCLCTTAIGCWRLFDDTGRLSLVARYFAEAGNWTDIRCLARTPFGVAEPLYAVIASSVGAAGSCD